MNGQAICGAESANIIIEEWAVADLHRSKRSSAWGPPGLKGPTKFIIKKGYGITITRNAFNTILIKLLI